MFRPVPEGNQICASLSSETDETVTHFPTTPTSRVLEVACGLSADEVQRLAHRPEAVVPVASLIEPGMSGGHRIHQALAGMILAVGVAGLLILTIA